RRMCVIGNRIRVLFFQDNQTTRSPPAEARGSSSLSEEEMVGTARFELATSRTPSVRATRLRYVPTGELTTTRQVSRGPNRGSNCNFKAITAVRAASRKCAAYRANQAASCGPEAAPRLRLRGSRPHSPHPNFLHARAETGAPPRW